MQPDEKRIGFLDSARGLAVLLMVAYHAAFSLVNIFGVEIPLFHSAAVEKVAVPVFGGSFILISGICTRFSHNPLRRGLMVFSLGLLMTAATALAVPQFIIRFGILHIMGLAMVLFSFLHPALDKLPPKPAAIILGLLFLATFHLPRNYLGWPGLLAVKLPAITVPWLYPLGLVAPGFYSSDYYPLMPWLFLFLLGSMLGVGVKARKGPQALYRLRLPWLEAVGRRSLWIYVLHQPVIVGVIWLFRFCAGR